MVFSCPGPPRVVDYSLFAGLRLKTSMKATGYMAAHSRLNTANLQPFKKGQSGNPKGRPRKRVDRLTIEERQDLLKEYEWLTPLRFLMSVYVCDEVDLGTRIEAAKSCLPYLHSKMPQMVTFTNPEQIARMLPPLKVEFIDPDRTALEAEAEANTSPETVLKESQAANLSADHIDPPSKPGARGPSARGASATRGKRKS